MEEEDSILNIIQGYLDEQDGRVLTHRNSASSSEYSWCSVYSGTPIFNTARAVEVPKPLHTKFAPTVHDLYSGSNYTVVEETHGSQSHMPADIVRDSVVYSHLSKLGPDQDANLSISALDFQALNTAPTSNHEKAQVLATKGFPRHPPYAASCVLDPEKEELKNISEAGRIRSAVHAEQLADISGCMGYRPTKLSLTRWYFWALFRSVLFYYGSAKDSAPRGYIDIRTYHIRKSESVCFSLDRTSEYKTSGISKHKTLTLFTPDTSSFHCWCHFLTKCRIGSPIVSLDNSKKELQARQDINPLRNFMVPDP